MAFREFLDWCNERAGVSMTDNEIVKALECMATNVLYNEDMQTASICLHAKETIERKKAEIEELQEINKSLKEDRPFLIAVARAEAIKEFAERLKNEIDIRPTHSKEHNEFVFFLIDELVKEMVGDNE